MDDRELEKMPETVEGTETAAESEAEAVSEAVAEAAEESVAETVSESIAEPAEESVAQTVSESATGTVADEPVKGNSTPALIAMGVLFVLMVGLSIYVATALSKELRFGKKEDKKYEAETENPWDEIFGKENGETEKKEPAETEPGDEGVQDGESAKSAGEMIDWSDNSWKEYPNHKRSEYEGQEYFQEFADSIDETVSYSIERQFETVYDKQLGVCLRASYVQLKGKIPNLEDINRQLKENGLYYQQYYRDEKDAIDQSLRSRKDNVFLAQTACYVPYNDEDTISVIYMDDVMLAGHTDVHLTAVNINLITGTILENEKIVNLPENFGTEFRERSEKQNGGSAGTDQFSDSQILSMLQSDDHMIVFYTPIGLEIGYEYAGQAGSGWITISLRDYEKYLWGV